MQLTRTFASDNYAGVHPEIINAIIKTNRGHAKAYGDDEYTHRAIARFKEHFGSDTEPYFVFNGTAANVLALVAITKSYNSIICAETAHLHLHEAGAPEKFTGCKLLTLPSKDGKITVKQIEKLLYSKGDQHQSQPKVISITQSTDYGTVYTLEEMKQIAGFAHENDILLHVDGARFANAAAALNISLKEISKGVDVLSFGGTKNGMMFGDAIIFLNSELAKNFQYIRKQGMQLGSKMRFVSSQFETLLSNDLWLKNANRSNAMAKSLARSMETISEIKITQKVETNMVFAILPKQIIVPLQKKYPFYVVNEQANEARFVTAFDTTQEDIHNFIGEIKDLIYKR